MDRLALLSFPGLNAPGSIPLLGANPGDVIVSVTTITAGSLGTDYTGAFMREVQFLGQTPLPGGGPFPYIVQTTHDDLSALAFIALVRRKEGDQQS